MDAACRIAVIYTGGTLGMAENSSGQLVPLELGELERPLMALAPAGLLLSLMPVRRRGQLLAPIDSSAVNPEFWQALHETIVGALQEHRAAVVIHGTDTMAYSLAAMGFALGPLSDHVVFTGSQRPLLEEGSDAPANVKLALSAAASNNGFRLAFGGELLSGMRVSKAHSHADVGFVERKSTQRLALTGVSSGVVNWAEGVADIVETPAISASVLEAQLSVVSAAVLRIYGSGTTALPLSDIIAAAKRQNPELRALLLVSACHHGGTESGRYGASAESGFGIFDGLDITPEAAVVKLMWLLGDDGRKASLASLLKVNVAGELGGVIS